MLILAKTFEFSAGHRLFRPEWSLEQNLQVYGKCANEQGHGHNYTLEVQVAGLPDPKTGMVIDASILDRLVQDTLLNEVDHKNLDREVEWLAGKVTTVENILTAMWDRLKKTLSQIETEAKLHQMVLWETKRIYAIRTRDVTEK